MRISDWSSDVCSSDLHLRRRTGMNRDRLSGVELDAVAPRREDGLDDGEDGRMLDQRGGTFRASEQPPEPLGRRAVETALAKRSARERAGKIGIERGDQIGRAHV